MPGSTPPTSSERDGGDRRTWYLLAVLAALHAAAVLAVPVLPTIDGPAHAWNAALLAHWNDPAWASITGWFQLEARPVPNWTGHLLLAALQGIFAPELADRVLLAGYSLALPLCAAWALAALRRGSGFLAVLLLPLVHGVSFHMGFVNFCLGTVLWWLMLGAYWRLRHGPPWRLGAVLCGLGFALYFTHGLVWMLAWGTLLVLALFAWGIERRGAFVPLALAAAALPTAALAVVFARGSEGLLWMLDAGERVRHLAGMETLVSLHPLERVLAPATGLVVAAAVALALLGARSRPLRAADGGIAVLVIALLLYFAAPDGISGATFVHVRVMLFVLFAGAMVAAARLPRGRPLWAVAGVAIALSLALLGLRAARWHQLGTAVSERVDVLDSLPDGDVVVHVMASRIGHPWPDETLPWRIRPLAHVVGWSAAKRPLRALPNYEAGTGHFPLQWAPGHDPRPQLDGWLNAPPPLDLPGWEQRGETVDWVLVSGTPDTGAWTPIGAFLRAHFEQVEQGTGWSLYRRRSP